MTQSAVEVARLSRHPTRRLIISWIRELALLPAIALLVAAGTIVSSAFLTTANRGSAAGILVVLAIGAAVGLVNGLLIVKAGFNALIFTLGVLILLAGVQVGKTFWIDAANGAIILIALALARIVGTQRG